MTSAPIVLYGIANCDTVRKARAWLERHGLDFEFRDFRKTPVSATQLQSWATQLGWDTLLNRRGTTWRQLPAAERDTITDASAAIRLMQAKPAVIRRPVLERGALLLTGFDEPAWNRLLAGQEPPHV
ncbi:MAG: ArsC family reductase [Betaproteobacteria bacterium]|nr:ArsC family reductase [Betaproteobacteria bacterium]